MRASGHNLGESRRVEEKFGKEIEIMDSKAVFTQECHKEAFKGLCINVLPLVGEIIENARKSGVQGMVGLSMDMNGYFSFNVHDSNWKMARIDGDSPVKIEFSYSEEIRVPEKL